MASRLLATWDVISRSRTAVVNSSNAKFATKNSSRTSRFKVWMWCYSNNLHFVTVSRISGCSFSKTTYYFEVYYSSRLFQCISNVCIWELKTSSAHSVAKHAGPSLRLRVMCSKCMETRNWSWRRPWSAIFATQRFIIRKSNNCSKS